MQEAGFEEFEVYVLSRQNTVTQKLQCDRFWNFSRIHNLLGVCGLQRHDGIRKYWTWMKFGRWWKKKRRRGGQKILRENRRE